MKRIINIVMFVAISFAGMAQTNSFPLTGDAVLSGSSLELVNDFGDSFWAEGMLYRSNNSDEPRVAGFGMDYQNEGQPPTLFMGFGDEPWNSNLGVYILKTGKTGIGTREVPADYLLAVAGKIIAEGVRVELMSSWPDYVFLKDYNRLSIEELEIYINKNGHLPNIPSAEEVAQEGIDVAEMQAKQMEKIEELALYVIELKKEIDLLKVKLESYED